jgi:uncharacterized protein (DUF1697 family)
MTRYVAFLRGINSGRNPAQSMENLRRIFEDLGFPDVRTVIASGNVLFETGAADRRALEKGVEKALLEGTGIDTVTIVRTREEIASLIEHHPFRNVKITPTTKPYATFLTDPPARSAEYPGDRGYTVLEFLSDVVFSVVDLSAVRTPDLMRDLEAAFGKNLTTRSWGTVLKVASRFDM